jgi:ATP-binding cassette subfamily B (MDR/TAP) protein 1
MLFSILSGLIPPYMTELIGKTFQAFINYSLIAATSPSSDELSIAKAALLQSTKISSLKFLGLGIGILITSTVSLGLWALNGENVAKALRREVFMGISSRGLAWFDLGMGSETTEGEEEGDESEGGQGAGGLMGRFAR